jgi:hypothetical protein
MLFAEKNCFFQLSIGRHWSDTNKALVGVGPTPIVTWFHLTITAPLNL